MKEIDELILLHKNQIKLLQKFKKSNLEDDETFKKYLEVIEKIKENYKKNGVEK